jgi:hypothetical protein
VTTRYDKPRLIYPDSVESTGPSSSCRPSGQRLGAGVHTEDQAHQDVLDLMLDLINEGAP